jgi:hypothetical protein
MYKKIPVVSLIVLIFLSVLISSDKTTYRKLKILNYIEKMKAGWIGQMVGVGWGGPTEFQWNGKIMPLEEMPEWKPEMVNQHYQDDIYVEMTFLRTLEQYGLDVSIRQAGIDFANSKYMLWHANKAGRDNLRSGIAPPYSGHPNHNSHADDIDYQIEADFSGLIAPGMPQIVIELGEKFGRLMNYGDGLYGGQFVGAMYAEAFFESDIEKIIHAGLRCIPEGSQYHECISDVVRWHKQNPKNWQKTWHLIEDKYQDNPQYRKFSCSGPDSDFNIDAKINGAYIVMGLLYGEGDPDRTIIISTRCGQDSDCNPSNAAGIVFTIMGYTELPERFISKIDNEPKFSYTEYNFPDLINVCKDLARKYVIKAGGRIEKDNDGDEVFVIPLKMAQPSVLEQCWEPIPILTDINFKNEEMENIKIKMRKPDEFIPEWQICGPYSIKGTDSVQELFDTIFLPEETTENKQVEWRKISAESEGRNISIVPIHDLIGGTYCAAYLKTKVFSSQTQKAIMELGSDDGIKVWVNGELLHQNNAMRAHMAGQDRVEFILKEGWNTIMLKVTQGEGGWEVSACLCDLNGNVLKDLTYKAE